MKETRYFLVKGVKSKRYFSFFVGNRVSCTKFRAEAHSFKTADQADKLRQYFDQLNSFAIEEYVAEELTLK